MFRDGNMDNIQFQYMILRFQRKYASPLKKRSMNTCLKEVPSTKHLKEQIGKLHTEINPHSHSPNDRTWNEIFHTVVNSCNLQERFPLHTLPKSYSVGSSCSHVYHIDKQKTINTTLHLTMLEQTKLGSEITLPSKETTSSFISLVVNNNPIWDLGMQFMSIQKDTDRMYTNLKVEAKGYTKACICPCSKLLHEWHKSNFMNGYMGFNQCESLVFNDPTTFVNHIQREHNDYYHRIIMRIIQCSYSSLLAKFTMSIDTSLYKSFHRIHKGSVKLPTYMNTGANYTTFRISK